MLIGNLKIENPIFLAPMAGITDNPFRVICREMGAGVVYTEFVSSNGIVRENMKTLNLMNFTEQERPIGIQIFGETPEVVGESAKIIYDKFKPDIIDINYGCPVPKVTKKGAGSAALKDLCLMEDITISVIESVPNVPITIKMRAGWDNNSIVSTEAGVKMEKIGVSAITLHPRTTNQKFSGRSNWDLIKELKDSVNIPVIGNGDISSVADSDEMKKFTGCDAIMIGRAALGNPWIFKSINLNKDIASIKSIPEIISVSYRHFKMLESYYDSNICINHAKKHFSWYFKGFDEASNWRKKFMSAVSIKEIYNNLNEMKSYYN